MRSTAGGAGGAGSRWRTLGVCAMDKSCFEIADRGCAQYSVAVGPNVPAINKIASRQCVAKFMFDSASEVR